jgi:predicted RNase H-like HicB family nuclease
MNDYHISVFYSDEDQGWIAEIPDLPGCSAYGDTPEQAVAEVGLAKLAWLETAQAQGKSVPEPSGRPASASG